MRSYSCQALEHQSDHTDPNHRFAVVRANFVVTAEATRLHKPAEGSLDDPALGQNLEAFDLVTPAHDLQVELTERTELLHPLDQGSQIAAIGPDDLYPAVHSHQELDEVLGRVAVLRIGGGNYEPQKKHPANPPPGAVFPPPRCFPTLDPAPRLV